MSERVSCCLCFVSVEEDYRKWRKLAQMTKFPLFVRASATYILNAMYFPRIISSKWFIPNSHCSAGDLVELSISEVQRAYSCTNQ